MDDDRLARLEQRIDELDQRNTALERAMDRSRAAMNTVVPKETRRHMRAAWRENLLAIRSLIDYWAARLDDQAQPDDETEGRRQNIPID